MEKSSLDDPFLADAIAGYALGEVWSRPVLDHRTRQIAAVALVAVTALGETRLAALHVDMAAARQSALPSPEAACPAWGRSRPARRPRS